MGKEAVVDVINALYKGAGIHKRYSGEVNEQVARVLGKMLEEIRGCSDAFSWIPRPTGGRATISWIARNFARSTIDRLRASQSLTCARAVIHKWDRKLDMAGRGIL
ncbi:hypothetical protein [Aquisalimonas asiatica]|uniref:Uncharacterized protein n=1 Tax=Aquisalimonas asiatica TaxID=406100 RepID=A0A1H8TEC1_9GAMM|nr:hypothetical protein [Aquisalimonas asiatica]SEO89096.1 hypothetical protein SAMN04488052_10494 [Aquisalimonas asiatica]